MPRFQDVSGTLIGEDGQPYPGVDVLTEAYTADIGDVEAKIAQLTIERDNAVRERDEAKAYAYDVLRAAPAEEVTEEVAEEVADDDDADMNDFFTEDEN